MSLTLKAAAHYKFDWAVKDDCYLIIQIFASGAQEQSPKKPVSPLDLMAVGLHQIYDLD